MHPSKMPGRLICIGIAALLFTSCRSTASFVQRPSDPRPNSVQVLLGAGRFHKLSYRRADPGTGGSIEADLRTMGHIGVTSFHRLSAPPAEFGLDGGLIYGRSSDSAGSASGTSPTRLRRRLTVIEGFLGPGVQGYFNQRWRGYVSAGASLISGHSTYEDEVTTESESEYGLGGYARAGLEYRQEDLSLIGLGVRWMANELSFGGRTGDMDVEGWQLFLTYSIGF